MAAAAPPRTAPAPRPGSPCRTRSSPSRTAVGPAIPGASCAGRRPRSELLLGRPPIARGRQHLAVRRAADAEEVPRRQTADQVRSARHHCAARAKSPTSAHAETVWHSAHPGAAVSANSSPTARRALIKPPNPSSTAPDATSADPSSARATTSTSASSIRAQVPAHGAPSARRSPDPPRPAARCPPRRAGSSRARRTSVTPQERPASPQPGRRHRVLTAEVEMVRSQPHRHPSRAAHLPRPPVPAVRALARRHRLLLIAQPPRRTAQALPRPRRPTRSDRLLKPRPRLRPRRTPQRRATGRQRIGSSNSRHIHTPTLPAQTARPPGGPSRAHRHKRSRNDRGALPISRPWAGRSGNGSRRPRPSPQEGAAAVHPPWARSAT